MKDSDERSLCVRENEILTDLYKCKICSIQVKRDRMDIEAHLKQAHKISIKIYSTNFENPGGVRDTPEMAVEKLVREGIMDEPTRFMNKTPKQIKIKSAKPRRSQSTENTSKSVSLRKNKDRILSRSSRSAGGARVTTEVTEQSCLSDTNYDRASSSCSDSDSDCQVSKKRKKRYPSPPEKRSKLKISHVSSLANESDPEVKVKKEKEPSGSGISVIFVVIVLI